MDKTLQDLVWSVLPKEFKEEVKKIYNSSIWVTDYDQGYKDAMEKFFGIHNLTSDAEGEDEMLYVSRKQVQELYSEIQKIVPVSEYGRGFRNAERATLYHLFGSKCVLDEACNVASSDVASSEANVDSSEHLKPKANSDFTPIPEKTFISKWDKAEPKPAEPEEKDDCQKFTKRLDDTLEGDIKEPFKEWRDKNSSNVEKLEKNGEVEPKPAEPKFKPGDKVLKKDHNYENEGCPYDIFLGYIGHDKGGYLCAVEAHGWIMHESDLEPYTEPKPSEPKFKVGDKVIYKGRVKVVISEMMPNRCYRIALPNNQSPICKHESDLEPYTEPKESLCMDAKGFYRKETDTQGNKVKVRIPSGETEPYTKPKEESPQMKPIESKVRVYLVTKEEDEEFRQLLHKNGFEWNTGESLIDNSVWSFDKEESKIHNIYPNKIVTYSGDITPDILSFYKFKKQYFEENVNLSQETANCDKHFDNILKDGFSKERRLNIAAMVMQGVMANPYWTEKRMTYALRQNENKEDAVNEFINDIIEDAVNLTDALIAEAGKGDKK